MKLTWLALLSWYIDSYCACSTHIATCFHILFYLHPYHLYLTQVRGVLQILQGFSSSLFYWDHAGQSFQAKSGIYVTHLSLKSLHVILNQFMYAATCLKLVEILINKVEKSVRQSPPTLKAFACSISTWLKVCILMFNKFCLLFFYYYILVHIYEN